MPMRLNYITYKRIYNECKMHIKLYTSVVKRTQTHVNYYIRSGYIVVLGLVTGMLHGFVWILELFVTGKLHSWKQ